MKLFYAASSPFVRKVFIVAKERGLHDKLELVTANPWQPNNPILASNPAGKMPTMLLDSGEPLYDSHVICEYLDNLGKGPKFFPDLGPSRWVALRQSALGDATMEAMIARRMESRRPDGERSQGWLERQRAVVDRCLDQMEDEVGSLNDFTIGAVSWLCALGHLGFRFADEPWQTNRPKLTGWYDALQKRASVIETVPHD
ncbi:glutathione S-transferase [Aminobacter lissarensis]|uniref:Glutathione S-transferase n=1 Tax=Aminobacter carboxidus TaxID=376165 RepID=A0A8E2BDW3_9HYPH|nr:glutathione S-transferase N-terminal domain-containing protein [Aminobacter lissarensis]MBB6469101.1 glutathione S-transferase [Aminobacter lissarensis]